MGDTQTMVASQFKYLITTLAQQRAIAHGEMRVNRVYVSELSTGKFDDEFEREEKRYNTLDNTLVEAHERALSYVLFPLVWSSHILDGRNMDMFTQYGANEILTQIQYHTVNTGDKAALEGWLIVLRIWLDVASITQQQQVSEIRALEATIAQMKASGGMLLDTD